MSKLKNPREKKDMSLLRDCRNVYGEDDKASRKGMPRSKQLGHQGNRRHVREAVNSISGGLPVDEIDNAEAEVLTREVQGKRRHFRKKPDAPLAGVLRERVNPSAAPWQGGDFWGVYRERFIPKRHK